MDQRLIPQGKSTTDRTLAISKKVDNLNSPKFSKEIKFVIKI